MATKPRSAAAAASPGDQYRNHYQALEYGMFGALYNVAAVVLFISIFKQMFFEATSIPLFDRLWHFLNLCLGYVGILIALALSFDVAVPKKTRLAFHILLFGGVIWYYVQVSHTSAYARLPSTAAKDQQLYLSIITITIGFWVVIHFVFRFLGKPSRWRNLRG